MATRKRRAENASSEDGPNNDDFTPSPVPLDAREHILQIPESNFIPISLTGKGFERALLSKLDWMTYLYVLFDFPARSPPQPSHPTNTARCAATQESPQSRNDRIPPRRRPFNR